MSVLSERQPVAARIDGAAVAKSITPPNLKALTGLRFFAAASVIVCHTSGLIMHAGFDGNIAFSHSVSFFFVLSGFILSYVHPEVIGLTQTKQFWRARFGRIYPAHFFSLAFLMCFCPWSHLKANFPQFIANIFLVHTWIPHYSFFQCYNLPCWSVSDEFFFYLLFPLLIFRLAENWWLKLGLSLGLAMLSISLPMFVHFNTAGLGGLTVFGMYYFFPPARLFEFVLGMSTAVLWRRFRNVQLSTAVATLLEAVALAAFLGFAMNANTLVKPLTTSPQLFFQGLGTWLSVTGNCLSFAAMVLIFATERGYFARFARLQPFVWLGDISYSTYLLHYPIILGLLKLQQHYHLSPVNTAILLISILLPASAFGYHCIEMPMRKLIVHGFKKKPAAAAVSPTPVS